MRPFLKARPRSGSAINCCKHISRPWSLKRRFEQGTLSPIQLWPAERWWERSGWEEAVVLLAGLFPKDCAPVIRWLADAQPEVAAQCLLESGAEIADRNALFAELRAAWLPRLTDPERESESASPRGGRPCSGPAESG